MPRSNQQPAQIFEWVTDELALTLASLTGLYLEGVPTVLALLLTWSTLGRDAQRVSSRVPQLSVARLQQLSWRRNHERPRRGSLTLRMVLSQLPLAGAFFAVVFLAGASLLPVVFAAAFFAGAFFAAAFFAGAFFAAAFLAGAFFAVVFFTAAAFFAGAFFAVVFLATFLAVPSLQPPLVPS